MFFWWQRSSDVVQCLRCFGRNFTWMTFSLADKYQHRVKSCPFWRPQRTQQQWGHPSIHSRQLFLHQTQQHNLIIACFFFQKIFFENILSVSKHFFIPPNILAKQQRSFGAQKSLQKQSTLSPVQAERTIPVRCNYASHSVRLNKNGVGTWDAEADDVIPVEQRTGVLWKISWRRRLCEKKCHMHWNQSSDGDSTISFRKLFQ